MHEDHRPKTWQHHVGRAREMLRMQAVSKTVCKQLLPHVKFGRRVGIAY